MVARGDVRRRRPMGEVGNGSEAEEEGCVGVAYGVRFCPEQSDEPPPGAAHSTVLFHPHG